MRDAAAETEQAARGDPLEASGIPLETEGERLAEFLAGLRGVGETRVLLSRNGAAVACAGAGSAEVRLTVTEAVTVYTGLRSDQVRVMRLRENYEIK